MSNLLSVIKALIGNGNPKPKKWSERAKKSGSFKKLKKEIKNLLIYVSGISIRFNSFKMFF